MVYWIAECCSNHNGSFTRALQLIQAAKRAGFNAVKFQDLRLKNLFSPLVLGPGYDTPGAWIPDLAHYAHDLGLEFGLTIFENKPKPRYIDWYKAGSYESHLISAYVLSAGLWTEIPDLGYDPVVMDCVTQYPAHPQDVDFRRLLMLKERFSTVGWSDHTVSPAVVREAIFRGASWVELHFDLDDQDGKESGHSWSEWQAKDLINGILYPGFVRELTIPEEWPHDPNHPELPWRMDGYDYRRPTLEKRRELRKALGFALPEAQGVPGEAQESQPAS